MADGMLRAAAVQVSSQGDVSKNLEDCRVLVERAHEAGARLILLPENFAFFGPDEGRKAVAERFGEGGPIETALSGWARATDAFVIAGGMPERSDDPERPYNTCAVFAPSGSLAAAYRKIHLFDVDLTDGTKLRESAKTTGGSEPAVVDIGGFSVGLSICYDVRFPELYRRLVGMGASVLVVPAAFTLHTGKDHWTVLLRARAIESQSWVVAAAQWGRHPGSRTTFGHSMIIDPWGAVVAECSDRMGIVVADLDREYLERVRAQLPSLKHRRL
jgi:deaminated glutathione amidase